MPSSLPPKILILTQPGDVHAHAVAISLRHRGAEAILWQTNSFPMQSGESLLLGDHQASMNIQAPGFALESNKIDQILAVWRRRPGSFLDRSVLHPADREFAETECRIFRQSLFEQLASQAFWVNPHLAAIHSSSKLTQQALAIQCGLQTPLTLYGNDPEQIRSFIRDHPAGVIYKPFRGFSWQKNESQWASYTAIVREDSLVEDEILRLTPGIYQVLVPKAYELRVTLMGHEAFTTKIFSQETEHGRIDWRKSYDELKMEAFVLPESIRRSAIALMERLGLVFGCLDFIVTPSGEHVFLEVNEMGQFLFQERYTNLPLLEAFTDFLLEGSGTFRWDGRRPDRSYRELYSEAEQMAQEECLYPMGPASKAAPEDDDEVGQ